eukprot:Selendium_serpulae@DN3677_c0_g1_i1.p1
MTLQQAFKTYNGTNVEMDGKTFVKIFKDNGIIDKKFTATDADLVFAKTKEKGKNKISFAQFEKSLTDVATKKGVDVSEIKSAITAGSGPKLSGTKADDVRFHDDKSTYTGVHAKGGPEVTGAANMSNICDRSAADVRGLGANKGK